MFVLMVSALHSSPIVISEDFVIVAFGNLGINASMCRPDPRRVKLCLDLRAPNFRVGELKCKCKLVRGLTGQIGFVFQVHLTIMQPVLFRRL